MKQIVKQEINLNPEKEKNYLCSRKKTFPNQAKSKYETKAYIPVCIVS